MIYFERMDFAEHYHIEGKDRDVMRGPFQAKHINKSTACILKICESEGSEVNITSCKKINYNKFVSGLSLDNGYYLV